MSGSIVKKAEHCPVELTAAHLRHSFACFPSGVAAVCAKVGGVPVGMAMSSFTAVSLDPPLVSVCVDIGSSTWPVLRGASWLGVSVLAEHQAGICKSLAARNGNRFAEIDWTDNASGAVFIAGASLTLECEIYQAIRAGDHDIILLQTSVVVPELANPPLIFHGSMFKVLAS